MKRVLCFCLVLAVILSAQELKGQYQENQTQRKAPSMTDIEGKVKTASGMLKPGDKVRFSSNESDSTESIPAYDNYYTFREAYIAERAGDKLGIEELIRNGRMSLVPVTAELLVIEITSHQMSSDDIFSIVILVKVRVQTGKLKGVAGWVDRSLIRKAGETSGN